MEAEDTAPNNALQKNNPIQENNISTTENNVAITESETQTESKINVIKNTRPIVHDELILLFIKRHKVVTEKTLKLNDMRLKALQEIQNDLQSTYSINITIEQLSAEIDYFVEKCWRFLDSTGNSDEQTVAIKEFLEFINTESGGEDTVPGNKYIRNC